MKQYNSLNTRNAFTLAEALITVAVIGVIAALTIPAVVNNYQKEAFATHLKKIANDFTNATTTVTVNKGKPAFRFSGALCTVGNTGCDNLDAFMIDYMEAEPQEDIFKSSYRTVSGSTKNYNCGTNRTYRLPSGVSICLTQGKSVGKNNPFLNVDVDLNGTAGPNIIGRDFYKFYISSSGKVTAISPRFVREDLEELTSCILSSSAEACGFTDDVNNDGETNIADINACLNELFAMQNNIKTSAACKSGDDIPSCFGYLQQHQWEMDY